MQAIKHQKGLEKFYNYNYMKAFFKTSTAHNEDLKAHCFSLIEQKLKEIPIDASGKINRESCN